MKKLINNNNIFQKITVSYNIEFNYIELMILKMDKVRIIV